MAEETSRDGNRLSKVGRIIRDYQLDGMGDRLEDSWLGDVKPDRSVRELTEYFNRAVLETAMREADLRALEGEVENMYRLLSDDDISMGNRAEAEAELERAGIDVEALRRDFVSHQTIYRYLKDHRDVDRPADDTPDQPASALATIQRTRGRLAAVIEGTLSSLDSSGDISVGEFDVLVSAQVYCKDCDRQYEVTDLLERGGCDCE